MRLNDFFPLKGTFAPGETVEFLVIFSEVAGDSPALRLTIVHLARVVDRALHAMPRAGSGSRVTLEWPAPAVPHGYGAMVELLDDAGQTRDALWTAFDVLDHWTAFPRYGFLTDFVADRKDIATTLETLARFHINGLQFYDWQFRHDQLLPPEEHYVDPLGRQLSLGTVTSLIEAAHARGMATMPYLAVYAASLSFAQDHPSWALYDNHGHPLTFFDFLGIMNPAPDAPWIRHLLAECAALLDGLSFDGLHVDQYGDPKAGWSAQGQEIDIPAAFVAFIQSLKEAQPQAPVVFNAVGNWPIETLAKAPLDFTYIEIWPPDVRYDDVQHIVMNARALTGGRPVVIALYLPADRPENVLLADALIFSLGGTRIELGENGRLLADPYFPNHEALDPVLKAELLRFYDFAVRYGELIGPAAADLDANRVTAPSGLWPVVRSSPGWLAVSLINTQGLTDPCWDQEVSRPQPFHAFSLTVHRPGNVRQVWIAGPDGDQRLSPATWRSSGEAITVTVPGLDRWALVAVELKDPE